MKPKSRAEPMDAHVGARVKARRLMLKMSQTDLGNASGITFQQIQKYEKGANRISASRLQQFANILKVDVPYFFEGAAGARQKVGLSGLPSYVSEFTALPDGKRLMRAFMRIEDKAVRRHIRNLVDGLSDE
jgi:transcriptional regulator with XRE-family HTH domain